MADLFTDCTSATDLSYKNICLGESPISREIKLFCESLWAVYEEYADDHFLTEIRSQFYERYWEMYLTVKMLKSDFQLESENSGPDILINHEGEKIWIEAVTSTNGDPVNNLDVVPEIELGMAQTVPVDRILLRLRSSIEAKSRKCLEYIENTTIRADEPYVIALNGAKLNFMIRTDEIPYILKAILPIGNYFYNFDSEESGITHRGIITRATGAEVSTNIFLDEEYNHISAILYSNTHAGNFNQESGDDFILIHNPKALNPLPINIIEKGKVITVEISENGDSFTCQTNIL